MGRVEFEYRMKGEGRGGREEGRVYSAYDEKVVQQVREAVTGEAKADSCYFRRELEE